MQIEIYSTTLPASLATMFDNSVLTFADARTPAGRTIDREVIEDPAEVESISQRMQADHGTAQVINHGQVEYGRFQFLASR